MELIQSFVAKNKRPAEWPLQIILEKALTPIGRARSTQAAAARGAGRFSMDDRPETNATVDIPLRCRVIDRPSSGARGLVNEHDRDIIAHGIRQVARMTDEALLGLAIFEYALAARTDEEIEQLR